MSKISRAGRASFHSLCLPYAVLVLLGASLAIGLPASVAPAAVTTIDDVLPADNLATPEIEGLPPTGNSYNPIDPIGEQSRWEDNLDVIVGVGADSMGTPFLWPTSGRLDIDGNSKLRYQNLIIGQGPLAIGNVLITGIGALYSNNPLSLPPNLPVGFGVIPEDARPVDVGFDLIVGGAGIGKLEIRGGGRAEIQDAVVVGDLPGSSGEIIVDGFGSVLASGGFEGGGPIDGDPHQVIIGRRDFGRLTISNGGIVLSEAPTSSGAGTDAIVGASIGSDPFDEEPPELGGEGIVVVNGQSSKWVIGGSLQIGGFHDAAQGVTGDVEGDNVQYISEAGSGVLVVENGGLVQIRPSLGTTVADIDLLLAIGRFGRLELAGGFVQIGSPGEREDNIQLLNDGVISGTGRVETGVFINRYLGEVRVDPGEHLVINATSEFVDTSEDAAPMANYGVMRVHGTEELIAQLEFERAPDAPMDPIQPFLNLRVERPAAAPPGDFYGGLISGQHSRMLFRSGIVNSGMISFTAGENYVVGDVVNTAGPDPGMPLVDPGIIYASGPGTLVVFENDLSNLGRLIVEEGADIDILARHSFITAGELQIDVTPTDLTQITTAGDVGIAGKLTVNMSGFTPGSLSIGDTFEIISFGGEIGGVDLSDPMRPEIDFSKVPLFSSIVAPSLIGLGLPAGAVLIPEFTDGSVLLAIRSAAMSIGPDFNGDGIVDQHDLAIWKANKGIVFGATPLQGDANGDGAVNGADYNIWLAQLGMAPMPAGAGSGSGVGNVPEPAGLTMLSLAAMLALTYSRRRR